MTRRPFLPVEPPGRSVVPISTRHYRDVPLRALVEAKAGQTV
jgi:hypothetical protein